MPLQNFQVSRVAAGASCMVARARCSPRAADARALKRSYSAEGHWGRGTPSGAAAPPQRASAARSSRIRCSAPLARVHYSALALLRTQQLRVRVRRLPAPFTAAQRDLEGRAARTSKTDAAPASPDADDDDGRAAVLVWRCGRSAARRDVDDSASSTAIGRACRIRPCSAANEVGLCECTIPVASASDACSSLILAVARMAAL
eukprot:COSAG02_NODE_2426_length_8891_cov_4.565059_3_plen_203_part_00